MVIVVEGNRQMIAQHHHRHSRSNGMHHYRLSRHYHGPVGFSPCSFVSAWVAVSLLRSSIAVFVER